MNVNTSGAKLTFHWRFVSLTQPRHHRISLGIHRLVTVTSRGFGFFFRKQLLPAGNSPIPFRLWNCKGLFIEVMFRWSMFSAMKIGSSRWFAECLPSVWAKRAPQPHVHPKLFFSIYLMVDGIFDMCHNDRVNPAFCTPNLWCDGIVNAFSDDERSAARTILFIFTQFSGQISFHNKKSLNRKMEKPSVQLTRVARRFTNDPVLL